VARFFLIGVEAALLLALIVWVGRAYLASALALRPVGGNLERAVNLDPGDAAYHMRLGGLYEYSPADIQLDKAEEHFRRAAQLDPYDPETWLNLAAALEFQGRLEEAGACLRRVELLAPNIPDYQWPVANFYLLQGSVDEAFRHFQVVLAGTQKYNGNVFAQAWRATDDSGKILQELIPERVSSEFSYLNFLVAQKRLEAAQAVWKRIVAGPEEFSPADASPYLDNLIALHQPQLAYEVWSDLEKKGIIRFSSPPSEKNLISNGDFEDELLNCGFAWRIVPLEGVYVGLDTSTYHSPGHALLVQFPGNQNSLYQHVYQYVKVTPGKSYRLQAFMKTEGITTDSGLRLEVYDAYNIGALDKFSDSMTGNSQGWAPLFLDFTAGPRTELMVVRVTRLPSKKLDNLIAGKVWLDDVRFAPSEK
jgi:tetratricopeptide (TPR) repeat protein